MQRSLLILALVLLSGLSLYAITQVGLLGVYVNNINHPAGQQMFADIFIALCLFLVWMWRDAKQTGRSPWPWAVLTLAAGSFGPLLYLLTRKSSRSVN